VEKVLVQEADKSSGKRTQEVEIFLNFIGKFDAPGEAAEDDGDEDKRAVWREYKRKQREKKQQATA
jgi:hypothetical protein